MAKPLKFYQTLNQAPRSAKHHGKHRGAGSPAHGHSIIGTDYGAGGSDKSFTWVSWAAPTHITWSAIGSAGSWATATVEPEPPKPVPHAGIRTGELIGYRLWWLIDGHLCSLAHRRLWLPGETVAGDVTKEVGSYYPPVFGGTYAFLTGDHCAEEVRKQREVGDEYRRYLALGVVGLSWSWMPYSETETMIYGRLKMWGEVVEHQRGYRSEFAKVHSIDAIYGPGDIEALRTKYFGTR